MPANPNDFSKQETIAWEDVGEEFVDNLILSNLVSKFETDQKIMERSGDIIRRPMPYIARSYRGTDQTNNFQNMTQLSVPAEIDKEVSVPFFMTATELRDDLQNKRFGKAAAQELATQVNLEIMDLAASQSTIVVVKSSAASVFGDVARLDGAYNRVGVQRGNRKFALSTDDYNGIAADLANRGTMTGKPTTAYEEAKVGMVSGFDTYKLDYANLIGVAEGTGLTVDTRAAAGNYHVPISTATATTGQRGNYDNRYMTLVLSATTNVNDGDCFTIAGVYEVHHITKRSTGVLKTFRVFGDPLDADEMVISPPIISGQGLSLPELQYQNCYVEESATAAIVFLNTVAKSINPFWHKDAIELLPGRYAVPTDAGAGVLRMITKNGIEITMQKQYDINTMLTRYRLDVRFGVCMLQPEMCGIALFSQT